MEYQIESIQTDEQPVLCIHTTCRADELPQIIGQSYGHIIQAMAKQGEQPSQAPYVAYFNMDMQSLQIELGFPTGKPLSPDGDVVPGSIPAGRKLSTLYTGPYSLMEPAYEQLNQYAKTHGMEPAGTAYEYYLTGPEVPPEQAQTRIVLPMK